MARNGNDGIVEADHQPIDMQALLDSLPTFVTVIDPALTILSVNRTVAGLPHADVVGKNMLAFVDTAFHEVARNCVLSVLQTGRPSSFESKAAGPNDTMAWYDNRVGPIVLKGEIAALSVLGTDVTAQRRVLNALKESEERFRVMFESHNAVMLLIDASSGRIVDANRSAARFYGYELDDLRAMSIQQINMLSGKEVAACRARADSLEQNDFVFPHRRANGEIRTVRVDSSPINVQGRTLLFSIIHDITERIVAAEERTRLEEQLRHAQKMDAVGRLAGGVAHDFNNLLTVITANVALLLDELPEGEPLSVSLSDIADAAQRATGLTRQLLTFTRKQVLEPRPVDLNQLLVRMEWLLRSAVGDDIEVVWELADEAVWVAGDPGQLEQIAINLAVNARDAMPRGGVLRVSTQACSGPSDSCPHVGAGEFVVLSVADNGHGMDEDTLNRAFEPFFTTKEEGRGTGLGLATVYAIAEQHGGSTALRSKVGQGTTVEVCLPRRAAPSVGGALRPKSNMPPPGKETVLVVEDDEKVRSVACRMLRKLGYDVLEAACGAEALVFVEAHDGPIALLITDVVMPGMNGREVADAVRQKSPTTKVLFTSGYTADAIAEKGVADEGIAFLGKPYTLKAIGAKVRALLDDG